MLYYLNIVYSSKILVTVHIYIMLHNVYVPYSLWLINSESKCSITYENVIIIKDPPKMPVVGHCDGQSR